MICPGDYTADGTVDVEDVLAVIAGYGTQYSVKDLLLVFAEFGAQCPWRRNRRPSQVPGRDVPVGEAEGLDLLQAKPTYVPSEVVSSPPVPHFVKVATERGPPTLQAPFICQLCGECLNLRHPHTHIRVAPCSVSIAAISLGIAHCKC